mgnify:CR=1 FL=1
MDETEITNSEYRQFVEWVKDSTMRVRLAILADETGQKATDGKGKKGGSIADYAFNDSDPEKMTAYDKYMYDNYYSVGTKDDPYAGRKLNRKVKLIKDTKAYPDEYYAEVMDSMYLPIEESYNGLRTIDVNKLKFRYSWMDIQAAAKAKVGKRSDFVKTEQVNVYPDTAVWIKDFAYSYNEPMHNDYFWHKAYKSYPVVGVTWDQARAYCNFRSKLKSDYNKSLKRKKQRPLVFRLPNEMEWEYAARGGKQNATYPWGGPYLMDDRGCYLANFKPKRGSYMEDEKKGTYTYTAPVKKFKKNSFGLFDMAGNVSEWTISGYDNSSYTFSSTLNPSTKSKTDTKKSVRGGSWKDVGYMLMTGARDWEYKDSARSYIGFRTVQDIPEAAVKAKRINR